MVKINSIVFKNITVVGPFYLQWYYKMQDAMWKNTFKPVEKEVNQLKDDEKLINMLQGIEVRR